MSLLKLADDLMVSIGEEVMVIREKKYRGQINKNILELETAGSPMVRGGRFEDRGYGYGIGKPSTYGFKFIKARVFKSKFVQGENFKTYWGPSDFGEMRRWPDRLGQSKNYHQVIEDIDPTPFPSFADSDSDSEDDDGAFPAGYDDY
mgnify:FL=1